MQRIILVTVGLAILWSLNWGWGYSRNMDQTRDWFSGSMATVGPVSQRGFPSRYDVTIDSVTIPDIGFEADFLQIMRVVYNSDHRIIALPDQFTLLGHPVSGQGFRASVVRDADFARITVEGRDISLPNGLTADHGQISIIPDIGQGQYKIYIALDAARLNELALPNPVHVTIDLSLDRSIDITSLDRVMADLIPPASIDISIVTPDETLRGLTFDPTKGAVLGARPANAALQAGLDWVRTLITMDDGS